MQTCTAYVVANQAILRRIREQHFVELLQRGETAQALAFLRASITPLENSQERIMTLGALVMRVPQDGGAGRHRLLTDVDKLLSTSVTIPSGRLCYLLDQAMKYQRLQDPYGGCSQIPYSLIEDHRSDSGAFPRHVAYVLRHGGQLWTLRYSPDGLLLATGCADGGVTVWNTTTYEPLVQLVHEAGVTSIDWSPDMRQIAVGSASCVTVWDLQTRIGTTRQAHTHTVTSVRWVAHDTFLSCAMDKRICVWEGDQVDFVTHTGRRVLSLDVAEDLVAFIGAPGMTLGRARRVGNTHVHSILRSFLSRSSQRFDDDADELFPGLGTINIDTLDDDGMQDESALASSVTKCDTLASYNIKHRTIGEHTELANGAMHLCLAPNGEALISRRGGEVQLWDMRSRRRVRIFDGHRADEYIIRSTFGGPFVLSGSEDDCVYVWQHATGHLVETLRGHTDTVNDVAWQPKTAAPTIASCSDDRTAYIWKTEGAAIERHIDCESIHAVAAGEQVHPVTTVDSPAFFARPLPWD